MSLRKAIEIGKAAVEADNQGAERASSGANGDAATSMQRAVQLYSKAAELLLQALSLERDPQKQAIIRAKVNEFISRGELLKKTLAMLPPPAPARGAADGGTGRADASEALNKEPSLPLLDTARATADEGRQFEKRDDLAAALSAYSRATELYIRLMQLHSGKDQRSKAQGLRLEAQAVIERAEQCKALLMSRKRDAERAPIERALRYENEGVECQRVGDLQRAFTMYQCAAEAALQIQQNQHALWREASVIASRCMDVGERLKRHLDSVTQDNAASSVVNITLGDAPVTYPRQISASFSMADLQPACPTPSQAQPQPGSVFSVPRFPGIMQRRAAADAQADKQTDAGAGGSLYLRLSVRATASNAVWLTDTLTKLHSLSQAYPSRPCGLQAVLPQTGTQAALHLLFSPPPTGALPFVQWLAPRAQAAGQAGEQAGEHAAGQAGEQAAGQTGGPSAQEIRAIFLQLLQDLQLLHGLGIYGSLGRMDTVWVAFEDTDKQTDGAGGESAGRAKYIVSAALPRCRPASHEDELLTLRCESVSESGGFFDCLSVYQTSVASELSDTSPVPSASTDMWQWASLFHYALTRREFVASAGSSTASLVFPPNTPLVDETTDLLSRCLSSSPANRPSSGEAMRHPVFTGGSSSSGGEADTQADSERVKNDKIEALRQVCGLLRQTSTGRWHMQVSRPAIVETVCMAFARGTTPPDTLLRKLSVRFSGEAGIDAGGLTKELFTSFFNKLTDPQESSLFECDPEAERPTFLPAKVSTSLAVSSARDPDPLEAMFEAVGRVIAKAILEDIPINARLHPCVFRALLRGGTSVTGNLHDLETFSPTEARSCRQILSMDDVSSLYLNFEEEDGGQDVTNDNVREYVRCKVRRELVDSRRPYLEAMHRGFNDIPLGAHLRLFSVFDLMSTVCGKQSLSAEELLPRLNFTRFGSSSPTPDHLRNLVREMTSQQRIRFLSFVTASTSLPTDKRKSITIQAIVMPGSWGGALAGVQDGQRDRFPVAHTCFDRLDLPDYQDMDVLRERVLWCLDNLEMAGFGEA